METKSLVIFGMGMIVGYLFTNYMNSLPKIQSSATPPTSPTPNCPPGWVYAPKQYGTRPPEGTPITYECQDPNGPLLPMTAPQS